jgi:DNA-binding NtrC family response regulator
MPRQGTLAATVGGVQMAVILLVEDDASIRELATETIQEFGHETHSASGTYEALFFLRSGRHVDMLVADIGLGTEPLGGLTLAREAISLRPKLRVLYTTGSSVTKFANLFVDGAHFLQKPYTQSQLQHSIEQLLAASF